MINLFFNEPYKGLPYLVFTLFILVNVFNPLSPFYTHQFNDPDDYMRLNQVIAWLQGQDWYDLSVPRLSPGAHTIIHWSRLIDVPIALIALPFTASLGLTNAVMVAALIVPIFWFAVFLSLLPFLARPVIGSAHANFSCLFIFSMPNLLSNYSPGRVGHHGVQIIIAGFVLACLLRIIRNERGSVFALLAACALSCGFWIGTEAMPGAILFLTCLGITAATMGNDVARQAAIFGLALSILTTVLIPVALPATEFSSRAVSWFSPAFAIFAILSGAIFISGWLIGKRIINIRKRLVLYVLLGLSAALIFFILVPSALHGPFADYDAFNSTTALQGIGEAQPLLLTLYFNRYIPLTLMPAILNFMCILILPLTALGICIWSTIRWPNGDRLLWFTQGLFLLAAIMLALFWQRRVTIFADLYSMVPLTYLLCSWCKKLKQNMAGRPLFYGEVAIFLVLGPLPVFIVPAIVSQLPPYQGVAEYPHNCPDSFTPMDSVLTVLNDSSRFGVTPKTIMNAENLGPQILFGTQHNVIAGNFNVSGNRDAYDFFRATDDTTPLNIIHKWHADLVILCKFPKTLYPDKDYNSLGHSHLEMGSDGLLHLVNTDTQQPLVGRLRQGIIPTWLKPIEIPGASDYLLFEAQSFTGKE